MDAVSRRSAMIGALGTAGAALVGCTTQPSAPVSSTVPLTPPTTPAATPTPTEDTTPRWPLTGKVLKNAEDAAHIAVAVKVPDNKGEHPQKGLDKADIVYVQLDGYPAAVGQSGTRLVPIFHTKMAEDVGPVRSIRPVDMAMLSPITAIIGNTGGAGWVLNYIKQFEDYVVTSKTYMATKGTGSYSIDGSRVRTLGGIKYYDRAVLCHPKALSKQTKKFQAGPQQPFFPWAATDDEVSTEVAGKDARTVAVPWKAGHTYDMTYSYDSASNRYLRSMPWGKHILADGTRVSTDNVLVIRARQHFEHHEPFHEIVDTKGSFYYFHGGKYVTGTWTKGAENELFQFTLTDGSPLKMAPGQSFVELPQANAKLTIKA